MAELKKNDLFDAVIDGYTSEGAGVCRKDGMAVFVPGTVAGEVVRVRAVKVLKNYAFGRVERLLTPSPHRIPVDCPHFPACGGCDFRHMDEQEELRLKALRVWDAMTRIGGFETEVPPITPSPAAAHYRNKAQFPLGMRDGCPVFGFYRPRSHQLVPAADCALVRPEACALAQAVCDWAAEYQISIYDEESHRGLLRHVYVRSGDGHLLTVVSTAMPPHLDALTARARAVCPELRGIVCNLNAAPGNRILGSECRTVWGDDRLYDTLLSNRYALSPLSFYQVNKPQAEALYTAARRLAQLDAETDVLDLYCGIGTITLTMASACREIVGVEIVAPAVEDARRNAELNGIRNARFICADAGTAAQRLADEGFRPQVLICDPPRKGLDDVCRRAIETLSPARIVYISCDCAALARDAALLRASGYSLAALETFDLFPRTANVESVALLLRG